MGDYRDRHPSGRKEPLPWERRVNTAFSFVVLILAPAMLYANLSHVWRLATDFAAWVVAWVS